MDAQRLLRHLRDTGFAVTPVDGGGVRVAPASALTNADRQAIREHRIELLTLLHAALAAPAAACTAAGRVAEPRPWTRAEIVAFTDRYDRLLRWGWAEHEAERLAERLALRDHDGDDRRMCVECRCLTQRGRCTAAKAGQLQGADRALEPVRHVLKRCEGFAPIVAAAADGKQ